MLLLPAVLEVPQLLPQPQWVHHPLLDQLSQVIPLTPLSALCQRYHHPTAAQVWPPPPPHQNHPRTLPYGVVPVASGVASASAHQHLEATSEEHRSQMMLQTSPKHHWSERALEIALLACPAW